MFRGTPIRRERDTRQNQSPRIACRDIGAAGNMLLGSNATKVMHLAKVPVTLIK